ARSPGFAARSSRPPPADSSAGLRDLPEHAGPVAQHADLAAGLIRPVHGDLDDATAGGTGEQQELDVEPEALGRERLEQPARGRSGEGLESALRVGDVSESDLRDQPVEDTAG